MVINLFMKKFEINQEISDPITKRNYELLGNYFMSLIDAGLDFLKIQYVKDRSENTFHEFAADNYFDYILRDYLRRKARTQLIYILNSTRFLEKN